MENHGDLSASNIMEGKYPAGKNR